MLTHEYKKDNEKTGGSAMGTEKVLDNVSHKKSDIWDESDKRRKKLKRNRWQQNKRRWQKNRKRLGVNEKNKETRKKRSLAYIHGKTS